MTRMKKLWSENDVAKLRGLAGHYPTAQIAKELGRGLSATVMKAHQLQISLRVRTESGNGGTDPGPAGMQLS